MESKLYTIVKITGVFLIIVGAYIIITINELGWGSVFVIWGIIYCIVALIGEKKQNKKYK